MNKMCFRYFLSGHWGRSELYSICPASYVQEGELQHGKWFFF